MPDQQFDFGENWSEYSKHALTPERVAAAQTAFSDLLSSISLRGRTFLDIGFGQGLGLLSAAARGAIPFGCDINMKCAAVLERNRIRFPEVQSPPTALVGSILDESVVSTLRNLAPNGFDVVHSWGVLHHTGDMNRATAHAAGLVKPGGHFVIAIYNRHWSSRPWWLIKRMYVASPRWFQRSFVGVLFPVIYVAKWLVTRKNPKQQERGMDFYYDVVDWVGGYPYEYASPDETIQTVSALGFHCLRTIPANVPTGCNQFVFQRES